MALIELPNGYFVDLTTVLGVRPITEGHHGSRVLVDVNTAAKTIQVNFTTPEDALKWARDFAGTVNGVKHIR